MDRSKGRQDGLADTSELEVRSRFRPAFLLPARGARDLSGGQAREMGRLHIVDAEPGRWAAAVWRSAGMASVPGGGRSAPCSGRARHVGTETAVGQHSSEERRAGKT